MGTTRNTWPPDGHRSSTLQHQFAWSLGQHAPLHHPTSSFVIIRHRHLYPSHRQPALGFGKLLSIGFIASTESGVRTSHRSAAAASPSEVGGTCLPRPPACTSPPGPPRPSPIVNRRRRHPPTRPRPPASALSSSSPSPCRIIASSSSSHRPHHRSDRPSSPIASFHPRHRPHFFFIINHSIAFHPSIGVIASSIHPFISTCQSFISIIIHQSSFIHSSSPSPSIILHPRAPP